MNVLMQKFREVSLSVLPITIIVLILNFTIAPLGLTTLLRFIIGVVIIILGLSIFLFGIEIGITPLGNLLGTALTKTNKVWIVCLGGVILGFFISIAEPDLQILARQVDMVTSGAISGTTILIVVCIGIAIMLALGLLRIVYNIPLYLILTVVYGGIFAMAYFTPSAFLAISFDASGATTGALAVPFILALAIGVTGMKKDSKASEKDSFGLVAITSTGAIIAVMLMSIIKKQNSFSAGIETAGAASSSLFLPYLEKLLTTCGEVFVALLPILILYLIFQKLSFHLHKRPFRRILMGLLYTFIGLVLFLTAVNAGFMEVGSAVGYAVASHGNSFSLVLVGFVLGFVTILAEPAVYVLTHQIEDVTSGYVKRPIILSALSIAVGIAVALSMLRILIPSLHLWHILLPGYVLSIALMYIVPKLFVGIAFDAGGVASGPMTVTFILAFSQGASHAIASADILVDGFGLIALVAMTPIITLQILGFIYKMKSTKDVS